MEASEAEGIEEQEEAVPLPRLPRAGELKHLLVSYLEQLKKEELQEFQLWLQNPTHLVIISTETSVQTLKISGTEVASDLVARYGEHQAWNLAIDTWKQMGLTLLHDKALEEASLMLGAHGSERDYPMQPYGESSHREVNKSKTAMLAQPLFVPLLISPPKRPPLLSAENYRRSSLVQAHQAFKG